VSFEEGQALADSKGVPFVECSAKLNINVGEVFSTILKEIERESGMFEEEARWAENDWNCHRDGKLDICGAPCLVS
jgi:GTPase SAR1 family protein